MNGDEAKGSDDPDEIGEVRGNGTDQGQRPAWPTAASEPLSVTAQIDNAERVEAGDDELDGNSGKQDAKNRFGDNLHSGT